jgi:NADPH2:quinone reductase
MGINGRGDAVQLSRIKHTQANGVIIMAETGLQLRSLIKEDNTLELSLVELPIPQPGDDEVVVRIEATPINPSDLALLVGPADMTTATVSGTAQRPVITAAIPDSLMKMVAPRVGQSLAVGNEGAGVVMAAGASDAAQALLGKTVGIIGWRVQRLSRQPLASSIR